MQVRRATATDAAALAALLDAFNREFDAATPGPAVLEARLRILLADDAPGPVPAGVGPATVAYLAGEPAVGFALLTARPNVWYAGPVLLLDELYVVPEHRDQGIGTALLERVTTDAIAAGVSALEIQVDEPDTAARRFYERHGFTSTDPDTGDRALYYSRDLSSSS
ncbi:GNAT family N-acetyltransferase [Herbiconiux sp.]|uniref:GNAT family N-acetyltransferase n=1 Tax=Herbiconiux sp. TaxID=1871186 RepID=UPI0025B7D1A5|nr:GNAT family N-acetyltransferase [Herbiconiux sp.]